jgi:hypothetical protein
MDADQAEYQLLVANAAKAHRQCVALNMASALRSLYSPDHPTLAEAAEIAAAEAVAASADKALAKWRYRHGP